MLCRPGMRYRPLALCQAQVSVTVSASGRQTRPASSARCPSTAHVPADDRHSTSSVHSDTPRSVIQPGSVQTTSARVPVAATQASINFP